MQGLALLVGGMLLPACTLITDVDREDIPERAAPIFPEVDAGADAAPHPIIDPPDGGNSPGADAAPDAAGAAGPDAGADAG